MRNQDFAFEQMLAAQLNPKKTEPAESKTQTSNIDPWTGRPIPSEKAEVAASSKPAESKTDAPYLTELGASLKRQTGLDDAKVRAEIDGRKSKLAKAIAARTTELGSSDKETSSADAAIAAAIIGKTRPVYRSDWMNLPRIVAAAHIVNKVTKAVSNSQYVKELRLSVQIPDSYLGNLDSNVILALRGLA